MSNFVYDNVSMWAAKVDRNPIPVGEDPNKWIQSQADWNPAMAAINDLKGGVINNRFFGLQKLAVEPSVPVGGATDFLWLDNTGALWAKVNGVSHNLLGVTAPTLQSIYNASSGYETAMAFTVNDTYGGMVIKDAVVPITSDSLLTVQNNAGTNIFAVAGDGFGAFLANVQRGDITNNRSLGLQITNTVAADAVNTVRNSPGVALRGAAWDTTALTSRFVRFRWYVEPVSGAAVSGNLNLYTVLGSGAETLLTTFNSNGAITTRVNNVLTTQTVGFSLQNTTPATNAQQQYSPMLEFRGEGWSSGGGASATQKLALQARTIFAASSTAELVLWQSSAGAAYTEALRIGPYTTAGFSTGWYFWGGSATQPYGISTDLSHTYISAGALFASTLDLTSAAVYPHTDNTITSGLAANRWSNVYTLGVNSGGSGLSFTAGSNFTFTGPANNTQINFTDGTTMAQFFVGVGTAQFGTVTAGAPVYVVSGNVSRVYVDSTGLSPYADNTYSSGQAAKRWSTVNTLGVNSGAGVLTLTSGLGSGSGGVPAFKFATTNTLISGDRLLGIYNNSIAPYFAIDLVSGFPTLTAAQVGYLGFMPNGASGFMFMGPAGFWANTDNSLALGNASQRWATVYALEHNSGASTLSLKSGVAMGAGTGIAATIDTTSTMAGGANDRLLSFRNNGAEIGFITSYSSAGIKLSSTTGSTYLSLDGPVVGFQWVLGGGSAMFFDSTNSLYPGADVFYTLGKSGSRWSEIWARRHAGVEQTIPAAATITLDPVSGESIRVTLSATAITAINAGTGYPGEVMRVQVMQDATGGRSISGWSASFKLANGTYTPSSAANAIDVLTFAWDNTTSKWVEVARRLDTATGGGGTLAAAYASAASQTDNTLLYTSTGLGVRFRDNATPISGSLFQIQNSGATTTYFDISSTGTQTIKSGVASSGTAVAHVKDTVNTLASGDKILSLRNNTNEKFYVDYNGNVWANGASVTLGASPTINATSGTLSLSATGLLWTTKQLTWTESADASTGIHGYLFTGGAHTSQPTTTEKTDWDWNIARTVQWATGAITTQRFMRVRQPTIAFVGASTVTNAATFYIDGAPVAGTNATITNSYALWVAAGAVRFDGAAVYGPTSGTTPFTFTTAYNNSVSSKAFIFNNATAQTGAGAELVQMQNGGTEVGAFRFMDQVAGSNGWGWDFQNYTHITVRGTDGASAVALTVRTYNSYTTNGAKLLSVLNNSTEKVFITREGYVVNSGTAPTATVDTAQLGAGATCTFSGTAQTGKMTLTTGTGTMSVTAGSTFITVTLPQTFPTGASMHIWPADTNSAGLSNQFATGNAVWYSATTGTNQITWKMTITGTGGFAASTAYVFNYRIELW